MSKDGRADLHDDRLDKIFALMVDGEREEAEVARGRMQTSLRSIGMRASEVRLICGNDLLNRLYTSNVELQRRAEQAEKENYLLRKTASKEALRKLKVMRDGAADGWDRLSEIISRKVPPKRGWQKTAAEALGVSRSLWRAYKDGITAVPESVIERAGELQPVLNMQSARPKRSRAKLEIAPGTMVLNNGPMQPDELYLIGQSFNPGDWLAGITGIAAAQPKTILAWPKRGVPRAQADLLRKRYRERLGHSREPQPAFSF